LQDDKKQLMAGTSNFSFTDQYKYKGMRKRLAQLIAKKGSFDPRILKAVEDIPRHFFLDSAFAEQAYEDKAFSIGEGQTISQPYTVVYQSQLLDVAPGNKVLEIGTGSGYQACVLAAIGAKVYSIERIQKLSLQAGNVIRHLGYAVKLYVGDGTLGLPKQAPFDKILVTAAAPIVPQMLLAQLKPGGQLVIPVGDKESQTMLRFTRTGDTYREERFENFRFVPLIGEKGW
jgi:protein-L-isoaspartate(D-aspartate) O-methyltransferase